MLSQNLHQAAELITHFKQLAVDQTSAHRRDFDLAQVVGDVLLSMRPKLKKTPHQIDNTVPAGLRFDSFPGPLGQVLTNLINNALIHGLENIPAGTISITAQPMGDADIMLEVADNGTGIPKDIQSRIFDPFFTTRLGRGGSGLGLHLVFGIVTRVLGGQIQLISRPGVGTRFQIRIPRIAPQSTTEVLGKETP
jgi:signal transduction histidine kinase